MYAHQLKDKIMHFGSSMKMHLKDDTGADGNLLSLGKFFKHFLEANLNDLAKTIDPHT